MKRYLFSRGPSLPPSVTVANHDRVEVLDARQDLWCFGTGAIDWGRRGPQSCQLALALLADATGHDGIACECAVRYGDDVVARLPAVPFSLGEDDVLRWVVRYLCATMQMVDSLDNVELSTCHIGGDNEQ